MQPRFSCLKKMIYEMMVSAPTLFWRPADGSLLVSTCAIFPRMHALRMPSGAFILSFLSTAHVERVSQVAAADHNNLLSVGDELNSRQISVCLSPAEEIFGIH